MMCNVGCVKDDVKCDLQSFSTCVPIICMASNGSAMGLFVNEGFNSN